MEFIELLWLHLWIRLEYESFYFIILPIARAETFSENVAHAPYRVEIPEHPSLIQRELKALT